MGPRTAQYTGIFFINSAVGLADITDGTCNTFFFSERAHGKLPDSLAGTCTTGGLPATAADTIFSTIFPHEFLQQGGRRTGRTGRG